MRVFLIEKGWIDSTENYNADGYNPIGYAKTEKEAKDFCKGKGYWTPEDCWSINHKYPDNKMPKYMYSEIYYIYDDE